MPEALKIVDSSFAPNPPMHGFPFDWYWEREDGSVFSSARIATVSKTDADYVEWAEDGRVPTAFPKDASGADSVAELQKVLSAYDLHATLEHYAGGVRYAKVQEPISVTVAGRSYRFQTDEESTAKLSSTVQLGEQYEAVNGDGSFQTVWKTADGFTDGALSLADLKSVGLAIGMNEAGLFAKEAEAVARIAGGSLMTKAAIEAVLAAAPVARVSVNEPAPKSATKND